VAGLRPLAPFRRLAARWTRRKAATVEALKAHEPGEALARRKIRRQFKRLSAMARVIAARAQAEFPAK
jgi:hypothetical protein